MAQSALKPLLRRSYVSLRDMVCDVDMVECVKERACGVEAILSARKREEDGQ